MLTVKQNDNVSKVCKVKSLLGVSAALNESILRTTNWIDLFFFLIYFKYSVFNLCQIWSSWFFNLRLVNMFFLRTLDKHSLVLLAISSFFFLLTLFRRYLCLSFPPKINLNSCILMIWLFFILNPSLWPPLHWFAFFFTFQTLYYLYVVNFFLPLFGCS